MKMLSDLFINPNIDAACVEISFTCPPQFNKCQILISDRNGKKASAEAILIAGRENKLSVPLNDSILWEIDNPHLYDFEMTLLGQAGSDVIKENFGMRKIECRGNSIYVNNKKFYIRGFIRGREAHDHENLLGLGKDEYYAKNIRAAKAYGFNLVRFHSRIPEKECLRMADELGIFVHVELRKYYGKYQKQRSMMNDEGEIIDRKEWIDTVLSLRNHPSVMAYCMGNEIRHPGTNPYVSEIAALTKKLDPTRLFIDTCAHGEFDRDYVDFDVQHMSYYYPFGSNYDMFEHTYNWNIYGSCKGHELVKNGDNFKITRTLKNSRPILAHEICHYVAMRDIDAIEEKFNKYCPSKKPWWLDELKKLRKLKGLEKDWNRILQASSHFQQLGWKLALEAARRSSLLCGFHFLQLSDTEIYENSNGVIDCFDDHKGVDEKNFLKFNSSAVVLADLPARTFFENQKVQIPIIFSNYDKDISDTGLVRFKLTDKSAGTVFIESQLDNLKLQSGLEELCRLEITMPKITSAAELELNVQIVSKYKTIQNDWLLWLYPNRAEDLKPQTINCDLDDLNIFTRYPQLQNDKNADFMITNRFSDNLFDSLKAGKNAIVFYRVPETRGRINPNAPREKYYLPAAWDRFKGVIWDRGTNCGGFIRENKALSNFPNNGFIDLQFHDLINDCDKINLDDFPVCVEPIIQSVDKACRDRFDVYTYKLSELQPLWTMRKFAYLFEIKVGKANLLICGLNITGINANNPAACALFESLLSYVNSSYFTPKAQIELENLKKYLLEKSAQPRIKERKMTQFWQLNDMPLESDLYWKTAEQWIEADQFEVTFIPEAGQHLFSKIENKNTLK